MSDLTVNTLSVRDLSVSFRSRTGQVDIVKDLSFDISKGEIFSIIGESGSGKSTTAQAIMGLLPQDAKVTGAVDVTGETLSSLKPAERRRMMGRRIALISQDALTALNPCTSVGFQIAEMMMVHRGVRRGAAFDRAVELLKAVGISAAEDRVHDFPHEFSGGMRQRALIAMALALEPELLIADEPTTALDATIKAQILELISSLRMKFGMSVLLITHDMGAVARLADRMLVMYAGRTAEIGEVESIFRAPGHPYTQALLQSVPRLDMPTRALDPINGSPPHPSNPIPGCAFHPRCTFAQSTCESVTPGLQSHGAENAVSCHFPLTEEAHASS